ncbi:DUF6029 family protein [Flavobacterium glaciei]|uniref:Capsule assembly protein Wzi n=1 Tax=Flavobacterium glaciei TaxID=386300 RepID=A0A562Q1I3_9FLAO|nr:DUF6029 family protein [Flavobacterium glaciei]RDI57645.1 hypothetical protein DFR66_102268 [Flavobacterium glaciei]TWI50555.1 hypothetical protein IQ02_00450 [Flavobacterium glaciei]
MIKLKNSFFVFLLFLSYASFGQFSGTNLMEYQFGQIPNDNSNFSSIYDRLLMGYNYKDFKAGVTLEQYYTPFEERNYTKITQASLQYNSKWITVKAGNYQETLGRGLLLRSFEIPGAILEDVSYRSRNYFQRDILGFSTTLKLKNSTTKILYGKPLNNVFPPNLDQDIRRLDEIKAIYTDYNFKNQTLGLAVMDVKNTSGTKMYGMTTISGKLTPKLTYYLEGAKEIGNENFSDFSATSSHAYYGNVNLNFENLGITIEGKDYNNFLIGSGINEPPALIKEHTYRTLNRSTHVAQPLNESGYQIEAFYTFPNSSVLTLNHAVANNEFGNKEFTFKEFFAEYSFSLQGKHEAKFFGDYANDPLKLEKDRIAVGAYFDWKTNKNIALKTEYEFQTFERNGTSTQNHVAVIGFSIKSKWIFNVVTEFSNDTFLTSNSLKSWLGGNLKYQLNSTNNFLVFAGQRRGGPACNAGICYEVLDFKGIEVRWNLRF